jgi:Holliday junction resolvase RusA-like endonuclease
MTISSRHPLVQRHLAALARERQASKADAPPSTPPESPCVSVGPTRLVRFTVMGAAVGAPRQTQSDRWRQRPCVVAYRDWCDRIRAACPEVPAAETVQRLTVRAYYAPPVSWSRKKREGCIGRLKRTKPDIDNTCKMCVDALWEQDSAIAWLVGVKFWDWTERMEVEIEVEVDGLMP